MRKFHERIIDGLIRRHIERLGLFVNSTVTQDTMANLKETLYNRIDSILLKYDDDTRYQITIEGLFNNSVFGIKFNYKPNNTLWLQKLLINLSEAIKCSNHHCMFLNLIYNLKKCSER